MNQMILRIVGKNDPEILFKNADGSEIFRKIDMNELWLIIKNHQYSSQKIIERPVMIEHKNIIAYSANAVGIIQTEQKKIVTFQNKAYNILFPNCFYIIEHDGSKVTELHAFAFEKYEGVNTSLYAYPMPNMLDNNAICMGSANRLIRGNYLQALENIIFAEFTHSTVNNVKSFKDTGTYFEYLEHNPFPYHLLMPLQKTIRDFVEVIK